MSRRRTRAVAVAALLALTAGGCGDPDGGDGPRTLRIFDASSLTEVFTELAREFESAHDGVEVDLSFGGSPALVAQLEQGASADVLATADADSMAAAVEAGSVQEPTVTFARNRLTILVERGNPLGIDDLGDLRGEGTLVALCAPEVPCGRAASKALDQAGVAAPAGTREENVKGVVAKVVLGEVDAGIVYATDARAVDDDTDAVDFPGAEDGALTTKAVAAVTADARAEDLAEEWLELLRSDAGRRVLREHGFLDR